MPLSYIWGDLEDVWSRRMNPYSNSPESALGAGTANVYKHQNLIIKTGPEAVTTESHPAWTSAAALSY